MVSVPRTLLFLLSFLWVTFSWSSAQSSKPLYLSYEKRLILTYLLAGAGESQDVQYQMSDRLAALLTRYLATNPQEVSVKTFSDFLEVYQGPWPDSYSVESDLNLVENESFRGAVRFRAVNDQGRDNPAFQGQIDGFINSQNERLGEKASANSEAPIASLAPLADFILKAKNESWKDKKSWIEMGFAKATEVMNRQFSTFEKVGKQVAASGKLSSLDPSMRLFLETVLQEYFSRLSMKSKKQMVSRFLGLSLTASPLEKFEMMLMSSGPQFQKLLQVVSGNSQISKDLAQIFKKLESKVIPIPTPIVEKLFEAERNRYNWLSYESTPLGTGTMAQVHKGEIPGPGGIAQAVVIRFLKPEIAERVAEDARILNEIAEIMDTDEKFRRAKLPKLKPIVQDLNKTVSDELVLAATIELQKKARKVYNRTTLVDLGGYKNYVRIHVPFVVDGGSDSLLMVQELMEGRKLNQEVMTYKDVIPKLGLSLMEHLATVWTTEVLFGSGLFHADLHQGNFLVKVTDHEIVLPPLDFGMGGVLSKNLQQQLLLLGVGLKLQKADLIAQALWNASTTHLNTVTELDFSARALERLEMLRRRAAVESSADWMNWAIDAGLRFPYELVSLNRGMMILDQALKEVGSSLDISRIGEKLVPRYGKSTVIGWYKEGTLTSADLIKLGLSVVRPAKPKVPQEVPACFGVHR